MASKAVAVLAAAVLLVAAAMGATGMAAAHQCNVGELAMCASAIISGAAPTASCCASLRSQESCLCHYANNPAYSCYIPNARKMLTRCGIPIPHC